MLRDEGFTSRAKVDRYGRKLPEGAGKKELEKYYRIESKEEGSPNSDDVNDDDDEEVAQELAPANGHAEGLSSSDSSSSEDDDLSQEEEEVFGVLADKEGEHGSIPNGEVSSRLAVVNLDWDNIRAADLMAVFSSFVPNGGQINKIAIYPSEFGQEQMEKEEMEGPPKEIFGQKDSIKNQVEDTLAESDEELGEDRNGEDDEDERIKKSILREDEGQEFNTAKLRRYQLERLRYYYAVLTCSSTSVAQTIYDAVDGTEYLSTANFFDLRYIPPETDFSSDKPRDECERTPDGYRPNEFVTDVLQHSKVRLTWDAEDGSRKEAQKRAFAGSRADIDQNDLKAYLGSDSSDDGGPEPFVTDANQDSSRQVPSENPPQDPTLKLTKQEAERQKMRALLGLKSEPEQKKRKADRDAPVGDMQITFSSGLTTNENKGSVFENEPEVEETTVEKYVRKEKERKARRKGNLKKSRTGADPAEDNDKKQEDSTEESNGGEEGSAPDLGFSDPFFAGLADDKATTSQRKAEKRQKREQRVAEEAANAAERAKLELLMQEHDSKENGIKHFDINAIAKAEKALSKKKKSKSKKMSQREKEALEMKEDDAFQIDVGDDRFRDVFERSDFAIDPSHPRYKKTEGMEHLLEEGRKKRKWKGGDEDIEEKENKSKHAKTKQDDNKDVQKLVARVKGKAKAG